jgi:phage terminase large subunit-like protein
VSPQGDLIGGLSIEKAMELADYARIEIARRAIQSDDILKWGKALFPTKFDKPFCHELHGYFTSIRDRAFTNTEAPRNHAKTTIKCFLIPIYQALNEPKGFRHYLNVQSTYEKSMAVNRSIKEEIELNPLLRAVYKDQIGAHWTEKQFVLKNGVVFTCVGAGQSIRGINYKNVRPDYIMVDDLYDDTDINNPESTMKKNDWFWSALYPARAKGRRTSVHLQGTAINTEDLLEKMKTMKSVESRTFQAIKKDGTPLWPELNTLEDLDRDRERMGSIIFLREMQNERWEDTTSIIKRAWVKEYDPDISYAHFGRHFFVDAVLLCVDPSVGAKSENDPTGIAMIIKARYDNTEGNFFYLHDVAEEHLSLDERVRYLQDKAVNQDKRFPITQVRIESIAGFKDFTSEVIRRTNLPVLEIDSVKDKITNLQNKSHYFENGKIMINKNIEPKIKDKFIHQLITNHPKNDDMRDAVLLGLDDATGLWNFI